MICSDTLSAIVHGPAKIASSLMQVLRYIFYFRSRYFEFPTFWFKSIESRIEYLNHNDISVGLGGGAVAAPTASANHD